MAGPSALTRDLLQRLPGETAYEEVIIRERRTSPSWLRDNDDPVIIASISIYWLYYYYYYYYY